GPPQSSESYLKMSNIISAAEITNADAIHPGYGFLSENAKFSKLCDEHHIKFIGATGEMIDQMGDKANAKSTMKAAGVPCVPGSEGVIIDFNDCEKVALEKKLKEDYSKKYKSMLRFSYRCLLKQNTTQTITSKHIKNIVGKYTAGVSQNTIKRHLSVLVNEAKSIGMTSDPMLHIKTKKTNAELHKPYQNIAKILQEIKAYNPNLYLCCLMTYGCLLRPHREIRELTWSDFSDDLKYIHLSGNRNKSGRNRIVPVPSYIRDILVKGEPHHNIFSDRPQPLNQDYFKTLWSRFKRQSNTLEQGQTLYSFRHSGAIEIFKRTGSITKLQKAMGH
ncbi:tyrosine-type recombinase/integrase, partial [Polaribacter sp.]|nr:tyrosine-type recombinase/integrase [Polaribacter sp.]